MFNIDLSAGPEGIRQNVYQEGNRSIVIALDNEGITMELVENGKTINHERATYAEIINALDPDQIMVDTDE